MGKLHNDYTAYIIFKFNVYTFPLNSCSKKSEFKAIIIHNVAFSGQMNKALIQQLDFGSYNKRYG